MNRAGPNTTMLAESKVCIVERCRDGGAIHLRFGGSSVQVQPTDFAVLCETLLSALSGVPEIMDENWPLPRGGH